MSRQLVDTDLLTWEVYPSGGPFGLPGQPKVMFHCLSDPDRRPRVISMSGDNADAERYLQEMELADLQALFAKATELR